MNSDMSPAELVAYLDRDATRYRKFRWLYTLVAVVIAVLFLLSLYVDRLEGAFMFFGMLLVIMASFHQQKKSNRTMLEILRKSDIGRQE